jgi:hypothetical protein
MSNLPYITLHASQISDIAASIKTGDDLAVRVAASPEARNAAIKALKASGIGAPEAGAFTLQQLDAALDVAFHRTDPNYLTRRMELKATVHAGGLLKEKSTVDKRALALCGIMARKGGFALPAERPYSVAEFDAVLATATPAISPEHRLEIKSAFSKAGLLESGAIEPKQVQPISAAKAICDTLGLQFPTNGMKLSTGVVDAKMAERGWDERRRLNAKITLQSSGARALARRSFLVRRPATRRARRDAS